MHREFEANAMQFWKCALIMILTNKKKPFTHADRYVRTFASGKSAVRNELIIVAIKAVIILHALV